MLLHSIYICYFPVRFSEHRFVGLIVYQADNMSRSYLGPVLQPVKIAKWWNKFSKNKLYAIKENNIWHLNTL
jgi:hypothetical protein